MNNSRANELLQFLVAELEKLWHGEPSEITTASDAYEICRQIVEETEKGEAEGKI